MSQILYSQKVGIVLSGGGATAMAHIGFLKALEENEIPIDYITGTSMGAIIGSMYASGYTIDEIEANALSEEFKMMSEGSYIEDLNFYFKKDEDDASMITTKHSRGSFISTSLPTNLIDPALMNYELMRFLAQPSEAADYDFDNLFIPFRCLATDIQNTKSVIFDSGNLSLAVRASSAYPFYVTPVKQDSTLLYDGGLRNNFPSDVMYNEFMPDIIIGNNVSSNNDLPDSDDLISILKTMIVQKTNYNPICEEMIIVEPDLNIGTFDFDKIQDAIESGYASTMERAEEIKKLVGRTVSIEERNKARTIFRVKFRPLLIDNIEVEGLDKFQKNYISKIFGKENDTKTLDEIKSYYFKIAFDDKIKSVYPQLKYNAERDRFTLNLDIEKEKDILVSFGGNFSSRPINMGFVALKYNFFRRTSSSLYVNSYFGKFYGSIHGNYRIDLPGKYPISIQPHFTWNRWDYFKSFATFFEEVRPSFIVMNEQFGGIETKFPIGTKGRMGIDISYGNNFDGYYQTEDFSAGDTSDRTVFNAMRYKMEYDRSTLNRKFFANKGTSLNVQLVYRNGEERTEPGSTSVVKDTIRAVREWIEGRVSYTNYFQKLGKLQLGFHLSGVASTRGFFNNHQATLLHAPSFQPIPESKTFFISQHRANNFATAGFSGIYSLGKNVDFRGDVFLFKPFGELKINELNQTTIDYSSIQYFIGSSSIIYHTPLGPVSLSGNYYDYKEQPWSLVFNFGYMIFNKSFRN